MDFRFFCYVCKRHVPVSADTRKDGLQKFQALGHDPTKTNRMKKGLVGK